jgi:hypothetical protein
MLIILPTLLFLISAAAHANDSYCYPIQNADKKNHCLGIAKESRVLLLLSPRV